MGKKALFIACILALCNCCATRNEVKVIKFAHALDTNHPVHKAIEFMAQKVAEDSEGELQIKVYPSRQLGSERECLELLQLGSLDMTKVSGAVLENFAPGMRVFGFPFLFRDRAHYYGVLDSEIGEALLAEGEDTWLKGLGYFDAGSRSFYTKTAPVESPTDLKGLKIRVQESASAMSMVKLLGGSPTPISWGELYTALQQGIVDGAENNPPSFFGSGHYEVCKYYSIDAHTAIPDVVIIGTNTWNQLNEEQRGWLQAAMAAAVEYQREAWQAAEQAALEAVQAAGVTVTYPEPEAFQQAVLPMYEAASPQLQTLIESIRTYHENYH